MEDQVLAQELASKSFKCNQLNLSSAADYPTDIYAALKNLVPIHNDLYHCILAQNDANEVKLNCSDIKNEVAGKTINAAILINHKKALNPLISDELVMSVNTLALNVNKLDALFAD